MIDKALDKIQNKLKELSNLTDNKGILCKEELDFVKNTIDDLKYENKKLSNALDIVADHLYDGNSEELPCHFDWFDYKLSQCHKCYNEFVNTKQCWKEYFLREVKSDV